MKSWNVTAEGRVSGGEGEFESPKEWILARKPQGVCTCEVNSLSPRFWPGPFVRRLSALSTYVKQIINK